MLETLIHIDQQLLLFLNGFNNPFFDDFFWIFTQTKTWIPFYAALVFLLWRKQTDKFRRNNLKVLGIMALSVGLVILLADQTASGFMKPFFERFRPSHEPAIKDLVHNYLKPDGTHYKGGKFGFVSSHAANSFGIAFFAIGLMKNTRFTVALVLWALLFSYSRIYLGVHYPGDIICGGLIGMFYGWIGSVVFYKAKNKLL